MIAKYIKHLSAIIPDKDSLKLVRNEAATFYKTHTFAQCHEAITPLYASDNFQIQEVGVFLCGYIGKEYPDAIDFLHDVVSQHESWKVQEVLAIAFDLHCKTIGYEKALPLIQQWLSDDAANVRRAASEGLRIWTSRPYFKAHPQVAIRLLAANKADESAYVRKSVGNAIRDISKKHEALVRAELDCWGLSCPKTLQTHRLARAWIEKQISI